MPLLWPPPNACLIVATTAVCRFLSAQWVIKCIYIQRRICHEYDSLQDHFWYSGAWALETSWVVVILVSHLLSTANCSGIDPEIALTMLVRLHQRTRKHVWLVFSKTHSLWVLLSQVTVGSAMCREFDSHGLHIYLFQACALTTLWMVIFVVQHTYVVSLPTELFG